MVTGTDGLAAELTSEDLVAGEAVAAYDRLLLTLRGLRDDPALAAALEDAWAGQTFRPGERASLILAAWRFLALGRADHPLAPEVLLDAEAPDLEDRARAALAEPDLVATLRTRRVVSHDPGRAFGWGAVALALDLPNRGFALCDLAAIAGLHLVVDLTSIPFRLGAERVTGLDFPAPHRRVGLDPDPIDVVGDDDAARWLRACVWPGQPERLDRLEAAMAALRRPWRGASPGPSLAAHALGEGATRPVLEALEGDPAVTATLAFEALTSRRLDAARAAAHRAELEAWAAAAPGRIWLTLDAPAAPSTAPTAAPMVLTAHLATADGLARLELARSAWHPTGCVFAPGAVTALRARWLDQRR